jgi:hypothetical protein
LADPFSAGSMNWIFLALYFVVMVTYYSCNVNHPSGGKTMKDNYNNKDTARNCDNNTGRNNNQNNSQNSSKNNNQNSSRNSSSQNSSQNNNR